MFAELTKQEKSNLTESTGEGKQAKKDERHKKALAGVDRRVGQEEVVENQIPRKQRISIEIE